MERVKVFAPGLRHTIYALVNPLNNSVFYVGKTAGHLEDRLKRHLYDKLNKRKYKIIQRIRNKGLLPEMVVLQKCKWDKVDENECYWINKYYNDGAKLCNKVLVDALVTWWNQPIYSGKRGKKVSAADNKTRSVITKK